MTNRGHRYDGASYHLDCNATTSYLTLAYADYIIMTVEAMQVAVRYLIFSAIMFILTIGVIAWYETAYRDQDSLTQTVTSILQWFGTVVAGQVILIVMWEVGMVLASLYKQKRYEEGRQEARKEEAMKWRAWLDRKTQAEQQGMPFDEPAPDGQ